MAQVSVIDVAVQDEAFQKLREQFSQFRIDVGKQPDAWKKLQEQVKTTNTVIRGLHSGVEETGKSIGDVASAFKTIRQMGTGIGKEFGQLTKDSKRLSENVAGITKNLVRWVGIGSLFTGLLGGGSLFGLDKLAGIVGAGRRSSTGLGVSYGEQKAFKLAYGRYVDPDAMLQKIADTKSSLTESYRFQQLGLTPDEVKSMDPAQLAVRIMPELKRKFIEGGQTQQTVDAFGLGQFGTLDDFRRLAATPDSELADTKKQYEKYSKDLDLSSPAQKAWQDLSIGLSAAGEKIENVLVKGLTPLAGPLADLSDKIADSIKIFLDNPHFKEWMAEFGDGIKELATYMGTDKFQADVKMASDSVARFGKSVGEVADWADKTLTRLGIIDPPDGDKGYHLDFGTLGAVPNGPGAPVPWYLDTPGNDVRRGLRWLGYKQNNVDASGRLPGTPGYDPSTAQNPDAASAADIASWQKSARIVPLNQVDQLESDAAQKFGVPSSFQKSIYAIEGGLNPDGTPRISRAGAIGIGQLMPNTAKRFNANPYDEAQNITGSTAYMAFLLKQFNGDQLAAAAAYNAGENNSGVKRYFQTHDDSQLPEETRAYIRKMVQRGTPENSPAQPPAQPPPTMDVPPGYPQKLSANGGGRVSIVVNNNTGGNANVSASQAAHGY